MVGPKWLVHTLIYRSQQFSDHGISGVLYSQTNGYGLIIIFPLKIGHFGGIPFSNTAKYIAGIKSQISGFHIHEIRWNPINSYSKFYKVRLFSLHLWIRKIHDFPPPPASMPRRLELGSWSPACRDASKLLTLPNKMEWMTLSGPVFFCFVEHFWTEFMYIYI